MNDEPIRDALRLQQEAAAVGFDWRHADEVWPKLFEEIGELREATTQSPERMLDELGDVLFVAINLARHLNIDPATALTGANTKFGRRFAYVLAGSAEWMNLQGAERIHSMESLWREAKAKDSPASSR